MAETEPTQTLQLEAEPPPAHRRIGPYQVLRELSHGGMGTVFLAARADDQYQKRVAIKVVKAGMDSEDDVRHFRRERQILASLDHPNIARLLDGGVTDQRLPYFVMEFVQGQTIEEYCDHRGLSVADRLRLFRDVCSAVQYAHRNLIVHRDIKPGNIMVTADGVPKLLDFGIAKLLNPELAGEAATATGLVMTPEFASPEQARGELITTATDVYSLGVVLYRLLTGHHPYVMKGRSAVDIARSVIEAEPEKPSTAVARTEEDIRPGGQAITAATVSRTREGTPEKLRRRLQGDLDNIVLMALRKEPHRRYPSVEAFSEDIERYLEGRPVLAGKGSWSYRMAKFVRRNALAVAAAVVAFVLVAGFGVAMAFQSSRTSRALATAERERLTAERVSSFLVDLFKVSDPSVAKGNAVTAREILDTGSAKIEAGLEDQPAVRATLMETMGRVYDNLGLYDRALPLLQEALEIRRGVHGTDHVDVAASLNALANLRLHKGDYAGAEPLAREALAMRRKLLGSESPDVAASLNLLANLLRDKGDYTGAELLYREALAIRRKLVGNENKDVALILNNLGNVLWGKGDLKGAERFYREAVAILRKVLGNDHPSTAFCLVNLGGVLVEEGDYTGAAPLFQEALAIQRKALGNEHPDVAHTLQGLAIVRTFRGDYAGAEPLIREAIAIDRKALGNEHPRLGEALATLAELLQEERDYSGAERLYREALAMRRKTIGGDDPFDAYILNDLATLLVDKGDYAGAEPIAREALAMRRKLGNESRDVGTSLATLADVLVHRHAKPEEAQALAREALAIRRKALPDQHPEIANSEKVLGTCLTEEHRFAEAEPLLLASYATFKTRRGAATRDTRDSLERIVSLYEAWGKPETAAQYKALLPNPATNASAK